VEGMNLDFVTMNLTGFIFYSIYSSYGYFFNSDQTGKVDLNDLLFGYHACFATGVCLVQAFIFPRGKNKVHIPTIILLIGMWVFVIVWYILTFVNIQFILAYSCC
jgi:Na+-driven multidrug efflux pump